MDDDFEKKIDVIFKRIEAIISTNREKNFDIKLKRIEAVVSSLTALFALIISFLTLSVYSNTYNLTKEQFLLSTTENLVLSAGSGNVELVDLTPRGMEPELYYKTELSICIVNKSTIPISIVSESVTRFKDGNAIQLSSTILELDLPITLQPQETKFLDCYMQIKIPDSISKSIVEKFPEPSDVDFDTITKYLFFEKGTDLIGNEVIIEENGGTTTFSQHLKVPLSLNLNTSKGNTFSTQFYQGGPEFFLDKEYMDKLGEQYGSWSLEFSSEPIIDKSNNMSPWQFIKNGLIFLLLMVILIVIIGMTGVFYFLVIRKMKMDNTMTQNEQDDLQTEDKSD